MLLPWQRGQNDKYYKQAKRMGYRSRSALKLKEIMERMGVRTGSRVLDLGCAPGGWSQVLMDAVGENGKVIGLDLVDPRLSGDNFQFVKGDMRQLQDIGKFSSIFCDASPKMTGVSSTDMARAEELWEAALSWCRSSLESGGTLVIKLFQSKEMEGFLPLLRSSFVKVTLIKPRSSRKESREIYAVASGYSLRCPLGKRVFEKDLGILVARVESDPLTVEVSA